MTVLEAKRENGEEVGHTVDPGSKQNQARRILQIAQKQRSREVTLEESLSQALQAADGEFGQILREVDEISRLLKSANPDKATLQVAKHPAVWRAMKEALVDRELRHLALTDELTCFFNRRGFFAAATQQLRRALRNAENLLLFFCDMDSLKRINDTYGHQEGDLALIRVADAMEKTFRASDILARLGGDEFVVLTAESSPQSEDVIRRRLARSLKKTREAGCGYELSLSVGAARFDPKHPVTLGELMLQADRAMYEQKRKRQATAKDCRTIS